MFARNKTGYTSIYNHTPSLIATAYLAPVLLTLSPSNMLESIAPLLLHYWPLVLLVACATYLANNYFKHGLQKYPGPFVASLTNWWRLVDVLGRRPDITQIRLHRELGDIVRLGPNVLSFANPKALKAIYGLNKGFVKVGDGGAIKVATESANQM